MDTQGMRVQSRFAFPASHARAFHAAPGSMVARGIDAFAASAPSPLPRDPKFPMKRLTALLLLSCFSLGTLTACNTVAGAGKDVQKAGEKVEQKAEDCKDGHC